MKVILVDAINALIVKSDGGGVLFKEMYDLLETFPNKKIILTGANDEELKKFGLDAAPYEVFTLKHNPEKTNPTYYKRMLEHFNLTANDVLYFENKPEAVKSAETVGITTYHYDPIAKDIASLKRFIEKHL